MKLINIIRARGVIAEHAREKMPAQTAYKFVKFLKATDNDEIFYNDKLTEILDLYAVKDENGKFIPDGNGISLIPETADDCKKKVEELDNTIVEKPVTFTIDEFSGLSLSMTEILAVDELLVETEAADG